MPYKLFSNTFRDFASQSIFRRLLVFILNQFSNTFYRPTLQKTNSEKMSKPTESLTKLQPSLCWEHNLPFEIYCSHDNCFKKIRVCAKCKQNHSHHHSKYFTQSKQVVDDLSVGLRRCFEKIAQYQQRSKELTKLIKLTQAQSKLQYEEMEKNLVDQIKQDKLRLQKKMSKLEQICSKIQSIEKIKAYFSRLQEGKLLSLKISLSNEKGMQQFKQKNQKLCELMSKSSFENLQKLYQEFQSIKEELQKQLQNNFTFKLGQIVALKNSQKHKDLQKIQSSIFKQNLGPKLEIKEKPKPRTTLDFGEGIINGILNFLNL